MLWNFKLSARRLLPPPGTPGTPPLPLRGLVLLILFPLISCTTLLLFYLDFLHNSLISFFFSLLCPFLFFYLILFHLSLFPVLHISFLRPLSLFCHYILSQFYFLHFSIFLTFFFLFLLCFIELPFLFTSLNILF